MVSSSEYLVDLLRHEMGFGGMLVTDYNEIQNLYNFHRVAENVR
jgi:beta-glucosidase-like glycosyl hydrolase